MQVIYKRKEISRIRWQSVVPFFTAKSQSIHVVDLKDVISNSVFFFKGNQRNDSIRFQTIFVFYLQLLQNLWRLIYLAKGAARHFFRHLLLLHFYSTYLVTEN